MSLKTIFAVAATTPFVSNAAITSDVSPVIFTAADTVTVPPVPVAIVDNNVAATSVFAPLLTVTAPDSAAATAVV